MKNLDIQIAEKLNAYIESFKIETNAFKKVAIIHDYIEYIKGSNRLSGILKDVIARSERNFNKFLSKEIENLTLKELGYKNGQFGADDFVWIIFCGFFTVYRQMEDYKIAEKEDQRKIEKWLSEEIIRPDLLNAVQAFFNFIHQYIITLLSKEIFLSGHNNKIFFDDLRSTLFFFGEPVLISKQNDKNTVAHKILKYIFISHKDDLNENFFYSEMHNELFGDEAFRPEKYYIACRDINEKIRIQTTKKVENFLIFNTGKKGYAKINTFYAKSML